MAIKSLKSNSYGRSVMAGNSIILPGDYESIATINAGASDLGNGPTFSSIPQTFKHLQIRGIIRAPLADATASVMQVRLQFNGDSSSIYDVHNIYGNGTSITAGASINNWRMDVAQTAGDGLTSGIFAVAVIDILDYTNTNKNKVVRSLTGCDTNASTGVIYMWSGNWRSTAAINSITFLGDGGPSGGFGPYTQFALYGIRG